jgi:beta-glucosidase
MTNKIILRFFSVYFAAMSPFLITAGFSRCQEPAACNASTCAYLDMAQSPDARAHDLVQRMTLEEKVSQTLNHAVAIPRLGISEYDWWSEGLHGVARNGLATNFPQSIGLAATFDPSLMRDISRVIGIEGRAKYNEAIRRDEHLKFAGLTFWSPNVNIFRDPRWGRGQETFGEDPYLSARLGVEFVKGLQGGDPQHYLLIATPKHFAVHSGPETDRHHFDAEISNHDLEDTYLPAFRASIVEGQAGSIMCAYNEVDGKPACASDLLLKEHLRQAWGFKGFVVSDCDAVADVNRGHHFASDNIQASIVSLEAGTDLDCGATYRSLVEAVNTRALNTADLDHAVERLFAARIRLGMFDAPASDPYRSLSMQDVDTEASRQLALKAARESIVLLKNDGILPLRQQKPRIAVVGPTADLLESIEGNYNGEPSFPVTPLRGMEERFGASSIVYAPGSILAEGTPAPIPAEYLRTDQSLQVKGLKAEFFPDAQFAGSPIAVRVDPKINFDWNRVAPEPNLPSGNFAVRWSGELVPPAAGDYILSFRCIKRSAVFDPTTGPSTGAKQPIRYRLFVDGALAVDSNMQNPSFVLHAADLRPHAIRIEYDHSSEDRFVDLEWQPPVQALLAPAIQAARKADLIVAFVGLSPNLEGEEMPVHTAEFDGGDRQDIVLPNVQENLLQALAQTGKPLVVVFTAGSPIVSAAAEKYAQAILMAWYPGEEGGTAIAETIAGANNPSGRLPITFYRSIQDLPKFTDYSMSNRTYRYFTGDSLYAFGYGLSYSTFSYEPARVSAAAIKAGEPIEVCAKVRNTSAIAGDEVAQLYLRTPQDGSAPRLSLQGFERIHLAAGEEKEVIFHVDARQMSTVDERGNRRVQAGNYTFYVGGGQPKDLAIAAKASIAVEGVYAIPK